MATTFHLSRHHFPEREVAVAEDHRMVGRQAEMGEVVDDLPEGDALGDQVPGQSPMAWESYGWKPPLDERLS